MCPPALCAAFNRSKVSITARCSSVLFRMPLLSWSTSLNTASHFSANASVPATRPVNLRNSQFRPSILIPASARAREVGLTDRRVALCAYLHRRVFRASIKIFPPRTCRTSRSATGTC